MARIFQKYDFNTMPVVDSEDRLVGIITVDDVVDIMEQEATADNATLFTGNYWPFSFNTWLL